MEEKGKHYDFERTCADRKTAEHVLNAVINEYKDNSNWEIGKQEITEVQVGYDKIGYKVFVELTRKENNNTMKF